MRRSPRRRTSTVCRAIVERIACLSLLLGGLLTPVRADDSQPGADPPVDHPILVVAAASIDRLLERATTLLEVSGRDASPAAIQKMFSVAQLVPQNDGESLFSMKGIDTTKPIGALVFFGFSAAQPKPDQQPDESSDDAEATPEEVPSDGFDFIEQAFDSIDMNRAVAAIPMKNFDELIASLELTPIGGEPYAYKDSSGNKVGVRRSGNYLLVASDLDLLAHAPDPRSILRSVLGKQDVAVSFQTKGLPVGLRTLGAEGIKSVYAAMLQQRDDEPAHEYKRRRALGDLQLELLDLVVSHIDEVNLGARLDPDKREFVVEFDLAGKPDGKLAKFAGEWTPKRSPFAGLWQEDGTMSFGLSLAFPERHAKAISTALRAYIDQIGGLDGEILKPFGPLIHVGTKLIETGQLDVLFTSTGSGDNSSAILGIRVPGGPQFPEQFQQTLQRVASLKWNDANSWNIAVDSIHGLPVHRMSNGVLKELFDWTVADKDQSGGLSLVATPDAVWLATTGKENSAVVPDLLKLAVEHASSKPSRPAGTATRKVSPFRMTFRTREIKIGESTSAQPDNEADPKVRQVKGEAAEKVRQLELKRAEKQKREWEIIQTFFQEKGDAIHAELRPTSTGLKLTVQLEEALVAAFGRAVTFYLDEIENDGE